MQIPEVIILVFIKWTSDCNSWLPIKYSIFYTQYTLFCPWLHNNIKNIKWHLRQNIHPYSPNLSSTFFFLHSYLFFTHDHKKKFYQEKEEEDKEHITFLKLWIILYMQRRHVPSRFGAVLATCRAKMSDKCILTTDRRQWCIILLVVTVIPCLQGWIYVNS